MQPMSDPTDDSKPDTASAARRALDLKRAATAGGPAFASKSGRLASEKAAAARSASKSKPALRK